MSDKNTGTALVIGGLGGLAAVAIISTYFLLRERPSAPGAPLWGVGDVIWCYCGGDSGTFTIMDRREGASGWEYHIGEGSPVIDDLGWWTESQLLEAPWLCRV